MKIKNSAEALIHLNTPLLPHVPSYVNKMTDSLFLMQRYWGSDDDDDDDRGNEQDSTSRSNSFNTSENGSKFSNKKQKLDPTVIDVIEIDSEVEVLAELNCSVESAPKKVTDLNKTNCVKSKKERKLVSKSKEQQESDTHIEPQEFSLLDSQDFIRISKISPTKITDTDFDSSKIAVEKKKQKPNELKQLNKGSEFQKANVPNLNVKRTDGNFCVIGQIHQKDIKVKHTLPNWLNNPTCIGVNLQSEDTPISELNYIDSNTKKNLEKAGINFLFPVQLAVIPWLMQSKQHCLLVRPSDICVSAPTGSGKTLAFVLPIVQSLKDRVICGIRALVVLPVNELAVQVYKVFETFTQGTDLKVALLTGQKSFLAEQSVLVKSVGHKVQSSVDIVVTTPGRIFDHILRTRGFCLKRLRYLVIDEADRMMEEIQQGWLKQVEDAVFQDCRFPDCVCFNNKRLSIEPSSAFNFGCICQPLQKLLYSATLTHDPEQLHSLSLYKPKLFSASSPSLEEEYTGTCSIPDKLTMLQINCDVGIKPMVICHLIKQHQFKRVLCFTESVERAHRLHLVLEEMGLFKVREISSFNSAVQRKIVLEQFTAGKFDILVCSDLVARGIDIEDIDCVISYDVPQFVKIYIHRIGRTARAGKSGTAVTLLSDREMSHFKKILKSARIEMPNKFDVNSEDLKPLISSYQSALLAADARLRKEKSFQVRTKQKVKRKRNAK